MTDERLTDEDIRVGYLITCGWTPRMAEQYVRDNPKQKMLGESLAILEVRSHELGQVIYTGFKLDKLMDKIFKRFK